MDEITIAFDMDKCHMELHYPYVLKTMTLANLKKVFDIMCKQGWRNPEAISITDQYIRMFVAEANEDWHKASIKCQDEYICADFEPDPRKKHAIESQNRKLLRVVANKKRSYERCLKILNYFTDAKVKYRID